MPPYFYNYSLPFCYQNVVTIRHWNLTPKYLGNNLLLFWHWIKLVTEAFVNKIFDDKHSYVIESVLPFFPLVLELYIDDKIL